MARTKQSANGTTNGASQPAAPTPDFRKSPSPDRLPGPLSLPPIPDTDVVKVNNASLTELKNACDDAVKRYLARPELFRQSHLHTDVRLALGWASVLVAGATALYGYKIEFEQSKPVVWAGLILYVLLTSMQTLYAYFIEGNVVFVGKRKTLSKRIITERITLSSSTTPASKIKAPGKFSSLDLPPAPGCPAYTLNLHYIRSTSANKSLLARGSARALAPYAAFFDEAGVFCRAPFEAWVGAVVEGAMEGKTS
jgi:signal peptidase complex subunit 2